MTPKTKVCPKRSGCGKPFPADLDHFYSDTSHPNGLSTYCKGCMRERSRNNHRLKETKTTSTHFDCVAMQAKGLSVLVCLQRQRDKGHRMVRGGIPGGHKAGWETYYTCLDCDVGKKVKQRVKELL